MWICIFLWKAWTVSYLHRQDNEEVRSKLQSSKLLKLHELLNSVWIQNSDIHIPQMRPGVARPVWVRACHHLSSVGGGQSLVTTAINPLALQWGDKQPVLWHIGRILTEQITDTDMFTNWKGDADGRTTESFTQRACALSSYNTAAQMKNNDSPYRGWQLGSSTMGLWWMRGETELREKTQVAA